MSLSRVENSLIVAGLQSDRCLSSEGAIEYAEGLFIRDGLKDLSARRAIIKENEDTSLLILQVGGYEDSFIASVC